MGIYNIVLQVPFTGYTKWDWTIFLLLAVVPTVSHVINNWLLNYVNATTISMSILGEPVGASILAFFLLGERLNAMQMIGSILVLFGVSVFLLQQQKEQQKCRKRACLYTGIIMLREKRSCDTSLLFYRNTGVEGEEMEFLSKKMPGYIRFFRYHWSVFCSNICRKGIFSFVFHNPIIYLIDVELVFNKIYCWRRNNYY